MADKKVSDLILLSSADATDVVPIVDVSANTTKKTTVAGLAPAVASSIPNSSIKSNQIDFGGSGAGVWWEEVGRTSTVAAGTGGNNILTVTLSKSCKYIQVIATGTLSIADSYSWLRLNGVSTSTYERSWYQTTYTGTLSATSSIGTVGTMGNAEWGFNTNFSASISGTQARWNGSMGSTRRVSTFGGQLPSAGSAFTSVTIGFDGSTVSAAELVVLGHN